MTQPTLFDHPARPSDPPTSHDAARPTPERATLRAEVHRILRAHPEGLTDDRLWMLTGLPFQRHGSVVKRRQECGAVPLHREGESLSGARCTVWVLPEVAS